MATKEIPMLAVGSDELGDYLGDTIKCPHCGEDHPIENGKEKNPKTGELEKSTVLQFYKCGDKAYLAGIKGRSINR